MSDLETDEDSDAEETKKNPNEVNWQDMENIRVICRFRPINSREKREQKTQDLRDSPPDIEGDHRRVKLTRTDRPGNKPHEFNLDYIFSRKTTQQQLFLITGKPMVQACLEGYNTTIFAYGQTGSGKTYTMFGPEQRKANSELGIVQRCVSYLFEELRMRSDEENNDGAGGGVKDYTITSQFVQLYREQLHDLLVAGDSPPLKIRFDPVNDTPYVPGLKQMPVNSVADVVQLLSQAQGNRVTDATLMNAVSSRSHMIMTLNIAQSMNDGSIKKSKLNFADLAGSETFKKAMGGGNDAMNKKQEMELRTINLSLTQLTTCINYLSKGRIASYRSSQLTFMLMDSLGGNSKTTLIVACSPHVFNRDETIRTLRFAKTAKNVKNKAKVNKELSREQMMSLIKKLQRENKKLKARITVLEASLTKNGIELPDIDAVAKKKSKKKSQIRRHSSTNSLPIPSEAIADINAETSKSVSQPAANGVFKPPKLTKSLSVMESSQLSDIHIIAPESDKRMPVGEYEKMMEEWKDLQVEMAKQEAEAVELRDGLVKKNTELNFMTHNLTKMQKDNEVFREDMEVVVSEKTRLEKRNAELLHTMKKKEQDDKKRLQEVSNELVVVEAQCAERKTELRNLEDLLEGERLNSQQIAREREDLQAQVEQLQSQSKKQLQSVMNKEIVQQKEQKAKDAKALKAEELVQQYLMVSKVGSADDISEATLETATQELSRISSRVSETLANSSAVTPRLGPQSPPKKNYQFTDSTMTITKRVAPKKNLICQMEDLMHHVNLYKKKMADQEESYSDEMSRIRKLKDGEIDELNKFSDDMRGDYLKQLSEKDEKILELEKELAALKAQKPEKPTKPIDSYDYGLDDQIQYLQNLGLEEDSYPEETPFSVANLNLGNTAVGDLASWRHEVRVGSALDALDDSCLWWTAKIIAEDGDRLKIRYDGFDSRYDEWVHRSSPRLAPFLSRAKGGKESHGVSVQMEVVKVRDGKRIYKQGWLTKQGGTFKTYKTRYFELLEDGTMQYFKDMRDKKKPLGQFNVFQMKESRKIDYKKEQLVGFEIVTPRRTWRFQCDCEQTVTDWVSVIHALCAGLRPDEEQTAVVYQGFNATPVEFNSQSPPTKASSGSRPEQSLPSGPSGNSSSRNNSVSSHTSSRSNGLLSPGANPGEIPQMVGRTPLSIQVQASPHPPIHRDAFNMHIEEPTPVEDNTPPETLPTIDSGRRLGGDQSSEESETENNSAQNNRTQSNGARNSATRRPHAPAITITAPNGTTKVRRPSLPTVPPPRPPNSKLGLPNSKVYSKTPTGDNSSDSIISENVFYIGDSISPSEDEKSDIGARGRRDSISIMEFAGWMHKQGKWQANWTLRWCELIRGPSPCLRCFTGRNGRKTHEINFAHVRLIRVVTATTDKLEKIEIPTTFAFELVTGPRTYMFACKSRHELNIWVRRIRRLLDQPGIAHVQRGGVEKKSSIRRIGSLVHKGTKSLARLLNIEPEYAPVTEVTRKEDVKVAPTDALSPLPFRPPSHSRSHSGMSAASSRRSSVPVALPNAATHQLLLNQHNRSARSARENPKRRRSAPSIPGIDQLRTRSNSTGGVLKPKAFDDTSVDPLANTTVHQSLVPMDSDKSVSISDESIVIHDQLVPPNTSPPMLPKTSRDSIDVLGSGSRKDGSPGDDDEYDSEVSQMSQ